MGHGASAHGEGGAELTPDDKALLAAELKVMCDVLPNCFVSRQSFTVLKLGKILQLFCPRKKRSRYIRASFYVRSHIILLLL